MTSTDTVPAAALTVEQFCKAHGFGRNRFFALQRDGLAPRTFKVGVRVMISQEAAADWRRMMEQRTAEQGAPAGKPAPPAVQEATRGRIAALKARQPQH